jgi:nicotinamidase/pyrazinamidase
MSLMKKILITLAVVVIVAAAFVFFAAKKIFTPTTGARIAAYSEPAKALLVIDVQEDFTGLKGKQPVPYKNVESQITNINKLIEKASQSGIQVVYIRHLYDDNLLMRLLIGRDIEGTPGTAIDGRINVVNKNDFTKKISDSFSNPQLSEFLIKNRVDELYLVGLDAAYCVYNTAMGAKNRGYTVTVVDDAIMTQKDMKDVFKQYVKDGLPTVSSKSIMGM